MKKIFINGRFLTKPITGVQRYAWEVVRNIDNFFEGPYNKKNYSFEILSPPTKNKIAKFKNIPVNKVGFFKGHFWEQFELPILSRKGYLLNFCNTAPLLKKSQAVTIHDCAVFSQPNNFSKSFRSWYKFLLPKIAKRSEYILTVSEFSKLEIKRFCKIQENKIFVNHLGVDHIKAVPKSSKIINKYNLCPKKYILAVGSQSQNKNFNSILKAIELINQKDIKFVIVGNLDPNVFHFQKTILPDYVVPVGYVTDSELRSLYENALALFFPSLYEGFGLPPIEAMALGCPAIVSKNASIPEVCKDGALYCNPNEKLEITGIIVRLINDSDFFNKRKEDGFLVAQDYSWEKCTLGILKDLGLSLSETTLS